ncbi:hypothetical protein [Sphingobacterium kitahiroshimense]|uniref:hypothetical protein n=1 Tax=Sphingobacterium kitahiroshimense TaxID=470446 RepID=UPI00320965A7
MKKDFSGIGDRSSNLKKGKELLFSAPNKKEENTLTTEIEVPEPTKKKVQKVEENMKFFNVPLPESWHEKLKFDIAKDTGKTVKELILDAIAEKYNF